MKNSLRASALFLLAAAFARPTAAQTQLPPVTMPAGAGDDTTRVRLELLPDSLVAEPVTIDSVRLALQMVPPEARDIICDRIGCFETEAPHAFNGTVLAHVNYFTLRNRVYMQRVLERENLYFPLFEKYLAKYNLPVDLKYLAVVESALIPTAKSRVGATGLWQFMGPTANDLRLRRDEWVDERMNPEKATEAACKHLRYLYGVFHDWELVLAAYNWGAGNVQRVMRKSGKHNFWDMYPYMPKETRNYVPSFTAIMYAMKYARHYDLHSPELKYQYAQPMDTLQLSGQAFDFRRLSQAAGLDSAAILRFNPELRRHYLPTGYRPYAVQFPAALRPRLQEVDWSTLLGYCQPQEAMPTPLAPLPPRLDGVEPFPTVYQQALASNRRATPASTAATEAPVAAERTQRKVHSVRRGQTVAELAEWYGVTPAQLRRWNNLSKGQQTLKTRQQIVVFLHVKADSPAPETNVAVRPATAPAVAAAPRTPAEMGVKVSRQPVRPVSKPEPVEEETAVAAAPVPVAERTAAAEPRKPTRPARPVAATAAKEAPAAEPAPTEAPEPAAVAQNTVQAQQEAATEYVIRKGDYLTKLARERGLSVEQLMAWNNLKSEVVAPGQRLRLTAPDGEASPIDEDKPALAAASAKQVAKASKKTPQLPLQRVHVVQPGDTLYNISRRYQGLTVEQLRKLNHLKSDEVKPGQKLIVAS